MPTNATHQSVQRVLWISSGVALLLWLLPLASSQAVLFPPGPNYVDIFVYQGRFTLLHTARFFSARTFSAFAYPAGSAPIYAVFYATTNATTTYLFLAGLAVAVTVAAVALFLRRRHAAHVLLPLLLAGSYPLVFLIQRGNIELILAMLTAGAMLLYARGHGRSAAVLIGLAAAAKLYPVVLLGLFLSRRREFSAFVIGVVTFVAATAASIVWAGPTFAVAANGFFSGVRRFQDHYVNTVSRTEILWDHTLFAIAKNWAFTHHTTTTPFIHSYYLAAGTLAVVLFLRVRTMPFLNRVLFLSVAMVCLPPVSFDYTLVHLYVPFMLLLGALFAGSMRAQATTTTALLLLLVLFLPLAALNALVFVRSGLLQSVCLLLLLFVAIMQPWPQARAAPAPARH